MTLDLSQEIFENYLNVKFRENSLNGRPAVPFGQLDRQKDRYDEASRTFRNSAKEPKKTLIQRK